ncbi:MAG: PIN domain nuclease [Comamonadaceae bacterium]|nr:MAG: PIN domain nuclease [Comamonadaceae bacterium]
MITADSSVWIGYFNGLDTPQIRALDAVLDDSAQEVLLLDVVLMEVLRGFRHDRDWQLAREAFAGLPVATAGGEGIAVAAASLFRKLRGQGVTVRSSIDLLVGAWCIENGCALIHNDRDFVPLEKLQGLESLQTWKPA